MGIHRVVSLVLPASLAPHMGCPSAASSCSTGRPATASSPSMGGLSCLDENSPPLSHALITPLLFHPSAPRPTPSLLILPRLKATVHHSRSQVRTVLLASLTKSQEGMVCMHPVEWPKQANGPWCGAPTIFDPQHPLLSDRLFDSCRSWEGQAVCFGSLVGTDWAKVGILSTTSLAQLVVACLVRFVLTTRGTHPWSCCWSWWWQWC